MRSVNQCEELLILAPKHEVESTKFAWKVAGPQKFRAVGDSRFNNFVDALVEAGVYFRFDDQQRLPVELPEDLSGFRCVMIDPLRKAEFSQGQAAERLARFVAGGGVVFYPVLSDEVDLPDQDAYPQVMRLIHQACLTMRHPGMLTRMQAVPDELLVKWWLSQLDAQRLALESSDAGWAWGDPVGYHYYWGVFEAAKYFQDPQLLEPAFAFMRAGLDRNRWKGAISCGKRFALKLYKHTGDATILHRVKEEYERMIDSLLPDASTGVPPFVAKANGWVNNEVFANSGESFSALSTATGDMKYLESMVKLGRFVHRCCFEPGCGLWLHRGHVDGAVYQGSAPWGRGNGWMMYGIRGVLEDIPLDHPARPEFCAMLAAGLDGLVRNQSPWGLWFNVIDAQEPHTRLDTCGAMMFMAVYARAQWKGWVNDPRILPMCEKAWLGLKSRIWRGLLVGQACGTGHLPGRKLYFGRAHTKFHFVPALHALIELRRLREGYKETP